MLGFPSIGRSMIARSWPSGKSPGAIFCFLNLISVSSIPRTKPLDELRCRICLFSSSLGVQSPPNEQVSGSNLPSNKGEGVDDVLSKLFTPSPITRMIGIIRRDDDDMESKLNLLAPKLSVETIGEIFQVLNCQKIAGLRFFRWVQVTYPKLCLSAKCCSLIVNNCGWIDDYDTMLSLLKEFKSEGICLSQCAFSFLPIVGSSKASLMDSVGRLINMLNRVGGSGRNSGICALVEMFCELDLFDLAEQVIEMTEKKISYYHILIRQRCKRGHVEEVFGIIRKMKEYNCKPTIQTYNYLLSSLSKKVNTYDTGQVLEGMEEDGIYPDAITFEILIHSCCRCGKLDFAMQLIDKMIDVGLEPRLQSHDVILKAFFELKKYEEAHKYVVDMSERHKHFTSAIYCLLAGLHLRNGQLVEARDIIVEMMDKGNKPDSRVYTQILRKLQANSMEDISEDLENRYSTLCS